MDCLKYLGSKVAAVGGCVRDVVHKMNEDYRARRALKSVKGNRGFWVKGQEESICRSNCTNGIMRRRGMGHEKFGWSVTNG